jgi:cobalt-zinc-cadmium efflux system membrane fusion protein
MQEARKRPWRAFMVVAVSLGMILVGLRARTQTRSNAVVVAELPFERPVIESGHFRFSPRYAERNGIAYTKVAAQELHSIVRANGTVAFDARGFSAVGARLRGRIRNLYRIEGDRVEAGDALAEIESAELGRTEAMVLAARAKEVAADAQRKRERRLADAHISAERDAEWAAAEYEARKAERIAAERSVRALRGDDRGDLGVLILRSPISGKVVTHHASRGQTVEPTDTLFEIADLRTLWVELRVFEHDVPAIELGNRVEIALPNGEETQVGEVERIGDVIDPHTRTATVRVVFANESLVFRPGQSVHAKILTQGDPRRLPTLESRSLTRIDGETIVFRRSGAYDVEIRPVQVGSSDGERVAIVSGLDVGDEVVSNGVFSLRSELFR